ncbi:hypothetical protein MJO29_006571 [Puccinia striiformis f. sp. tritici]|nr:hypothetical protein Pst134EB_012750 [Puccinia striiformis f. sp. tritici]KAI7958354.1 hypothetical protein MJO29_006571 [Puccinia striiformis f. sp. tritici]
MSSPVTLKYYILSSDSSDVTMSDSPSDHDSSESDSARSQADDVPQVYHYHVAIPDDSDTDSNHSFGDSFERDNENQPQAIEVDTAEHEILGNNDDAVMSESDYDADGDEDSNASVVSDIPVPNIDPELGFDRAVSPPVGSIFEGSPRGIPIEDVYDLRVVDLADPRYRYNPFRLFPRETLPTVPFPNPPALPRLMFESVFLDLVDRLGHLLTMINNHRTIYHQIDVVIFTLHSACDWFLVYKAFEHGHRE